MRLGIDASNIRAGGGVTHLVEMLRAASPNIYNFERVVVWSGQATLDKLEEKPWLHKVHEPLLDRLLPARLYWQQFKLGRLAYKEKCDLLFVPGGSYHGLFRPFVAMSQNLIPFKWIEMKRYGASWMFVRNVLLHWSQKKTFNIANGLIFLTNYAQDVILKQITACNKKISIIPHGVDQRFLLAPRGQKDLTNYSLQKPFRFLYVSSIDLYKHQWYVVEAVAKLREEGYPVQLDFIGAAYAPALVHLRRAFQRFDPEETFVHYLGEIPHSKLFYLYQQADAFIFASSCENMPNILLEAMASGVPIASSNRGPMPEVLNNAGVYFDPEKPSEITNALKRLIDSPDIRTINAKAAYEKAKKYTWKNCANNTFTFFNQIATNYNR